MNGQKQQTAVAASVDFESAIQEALARIQSIYELVPDFQKTPASGISTERPARTISDQFLEASVVTVEAHGKVRDVSALDMLATRGVINRNLRLAALNAAAEALGRDVTYNMFRERWSVAKDALHVYELAKVLSRRPGGEALVPHVRSMRSALGTRRRAKAKPVPAPAPVDPGQQSNKK